MKLEKRGGSNKIELEELIDQIKLNLKKSGFTRASNFESERRN